MLYKFIALASLLAVTLAQDDDEIDVVDVELESTSGPDTGFGTSDSLDMIESSLFSSTSSGDSDSDSFESSDSSMMSSNSGDDDDDNSDVSDDSSEDVSSNNSESGDNGSEDVTSNEISADGTASFDDDEEDECLDLAQSDCTDLESADGDQECGFNVQTGECYSIERRNGEYGSGNYDDGYNAAKDTAAQESSQLYTVVGILSGVIGALVLVLAGGAYYFYNKNKSYDMNYDVEREMNQISRGNDEDGEELIKTVEDVSPVVTRA